MKKIGIVTKYDGKFGLIKNEEQIIEFLRKDISFDQEIFVGDVVEFRLEEKSDDLKLARHVNVIKRNN